ncbi:MAG: pyridoxamine 5'-phosphate oxidase family protein [Candidatus Poribacteria bacterium]
MSVKMVQISESVQKIINDVPCYVATASKDGVPNVSVKGSIRALDDSTLAFAAIWSQKTLANLAENQSIAVAIAIPEEQKSYQFKGTAELLDSGVLFEQMQKDLREINAEFEVKKVVKINLTDVYGV